MKTGIDEYDSNKVKKAKQLLIEVYEYNYKPSSALTKRLETILGKLDEFQEMFNPDNEYDKCLINRKRERK